MNYDEYVDMDSYLNNEDACPNGEYHCAGGISMFCHKCIIDMWRRLPEKTRKALLKEAKKDE